MRLQHAISMMTTSHLMAVQPMLTCLTFWLAHAGHAANISSPHGDFELAQA